MAAEPSRLAHEPNTELPLRFPGVGEVLRLAGRVARVRCPACGRGPVLRHWLRMRERCGACGILLERGEGDYFIGAMMFNLVLAELLFAGILVTWLLATWPAVHWELLQVLAPAGMILAPVALFPVSKLAWLAFDLAFRPDREGARPV